MKLAIIPARGGSKRIPRKNIKEFCGKPIIAYSIAAAIESNIFDKIIVSTDDDEIASIAREYGAEVPFMRSSVNSSDYASTEDVIIEVLRELEKQGEYYKSVCCIYPTAPFVTSEHLIMSYEIMDERRAAVVIPVVEFSYPPQRSFIITEDGMAQFKYPEYVRTRSQDLEKWYHDAGLFYVYDVKTLYENNGDIINGYAPLILSELEVQDIDTLDDWKIAEIKYSMMNMKNE